MPSVVVDCNEQVNGVPGGGAGGGGEAWDSVEAQARALGSQRGPDGLGDAPSLGSQARTGVPAHSLHHAAPEVGVRDGGGTFPHHALERESERQSQRWRERERERYRSR